MQKGNIYLQDYDLDEFKAGNTTESLENSVLDVCFQNVSVKEMRYNTSTVILETQIKLVYEHFL